MKNLIIPILAIVVFLFFPGCSDNLSSAPEVNQNDQSLLKGVPADGSGHKYVFEFDDSWTTGCDITGTLTGWGQFRVFGGENNRNVEMTVWHIEITYTNLEGETFVWHDVGPDHTYWVGDDLYVSVTGTSTYTGVIGHVVFNISQGEQTVQVSGLDFGDIDALACEKLSQP